jgi:hypothetical protein
MDREYGTPPVPRFPLLTAPRCKDFKCGAVCTLFSGGERDYYKCRCGKWCTYDDDEGVTHGNPLCDCGFYCRIVTRNDGGTFETCAIAVCNMSEHKARSRGYSTPSRRRAAAGVPSSPASSITASVAATPSRPPRLAFSRTPSSNDRSDSEFVRLLNHVQVAASRANFPTKVMNMSELFGALPEIGGTGSSSPAPGPFRLRSSTEFERHAKVGAAGELFVSIPHWSRV